MAQDWETKTKVGPKISSWSSPVWKLATCIKWKLINLIIYLTKWYLKVKLNSRVKRWAHYLVDWINSCLQMHTVSQIDVAKNGKIPFSTRVENRVQHKANIKTQLHLRETDSQSNQISTHFHKLLLTAIPKKQKLTFTCLFFTNQQI